MPLPNNVPDVIRHLMKDKGFPQKRAVAAALNIHRRKPDQVALHAARRAHSK